MRNSSLKEHSWMQRKAHIIVFVEDDCVQTKLLHR